jgi:hypothetical protein
MFNKFIIKIMYNKKYIINIIILTNFNQRYYFLLNFNYFVRKITKFT